MPLKSVEAYCAKALSENKLEETTFEYFVHRDYDESKEVVACCAVGAIALTLGHTKVDFDIGTLADELLEAVKETGDPDDVDSIVDMLGKVIDLNDNCCLTFDEIIRRMEWPRS